MPTGLVKATGANASLNLLWALKGALSGLSWQEVAREHRLSLLLALEAHKSDASQVTADNIEVVCNEPEA